MAMSNVRPRDVGSSDDELRPTKKRRTTFQLDTINRMDEFARVAADRRYPMDKHSCLYVRKCWVDFVGEASFNENNVSFAIQYPFDYEADEQHGLCVEFDNPTDVEEKDTTMEKVKVRSAISHGSYWRHDKVTGECILLTGHSIFHVENHWHYRPSAYVTGSMNHYRGSEVMSLKSSLFRVLWTAHESGQHLRSWLDKNKPDLVGHYYDLDNNHEDHIPDRCLESETCTNCSIKRQHFRDALIPWSRSRFHCAYNPQWCQLSFCSCSCYVHYMMSIDDEDEDSSVCGLSHDPMVGPWDAEHPMCLTEVPRVYCNEINEVINDYIECDCVKRADSRYRRHSAARLFSNPDKCRLVLQ